MTERPPGCETRNHRWDKGKGQPGAKCLDCGHTFGERPRGPRKPWAMPGESASQPVAASPAAGPGPAASPGRAPNEALRAKWGLPNPAQQQAQNTQSAPQAAPARAQETQESPPEESDKVDIGQLFRKGAPELIVAGEQKTIEWCGRSPDEPNEEIKDKFDEAFEKWTKGKGKMPKIELAPGPASLLLAVVMWIQMYMTGEPLQPRRKSRVPVVAPDPGARNTTVESDPASAPDTSESEDPPQSPPSSALPPRLSIVPAAGAATGAAPSSSVE